MNAEVETQITPGDETPTPPPSPPLIPDAGDRLRDLFASWIWDPVKFCNDVFERKLRDFQPEMLRAVRDNNRVAIKACRDAGKSACCAYAFWWWMATRPKSLLITTAPSGRQVKGGIWTEIRTLWQSSILPSIFKGWEVQQGAVVTTDPEWRAMGFSSDDPAKFEFGHAPHIMLIYDEAKIIDGAVRDSLQGLLTHKSWRELAPSTPGGRSGWFYDAFAEHRDQWSLMSISALDIPRLADWAQQMRDQYGEDAPIYRRQVLAEFAGEEDGGLIPLHFIEQCVDQGISMKGSWPKILAIDPAGQGSNETVVTYRWGPVILKQDAWSHRDEMETVGEVVRIAKGYRPDVIVVDKPGLGGPIISRLREVLDPTGFKRLIRPFNAGERARNDNYENLKTEVGYYVRQLLRERQISIPDDAMLIKQLAQYTLKLSSRGRERIVDPTKSPDRGDSLLMAFYPDISRPSAVAGRILGL